MEMAAMEIRISIPFELLKEKYLELVLEKGLPVEISLKPEVLDKEERRAFRAVAKRLREKGLIPTIHLPFMDLSLAGFDTWIRKVSLKRLFQGMEIASIFEPLLCVFHSGYHPDYHREAKEEWRKIFIEESLSQILAFSYSLGLRLALENTFEPDPSFMRPIFETYEGELSWCFDPAHARVFSEVEELAWLEELYPYLREMHCHDNRGKWDDHLALGQGIVKFPEIFQFLKKHSALPLLTIEAKKEGDALSSLAYLSEHLRP